MLLARALRFDGDGVLTEQAFPLYQSLLPHARYFPKGKLDLEARARAVENGDPVHLGINGVPGFFGAHALVVDGVERAANGRIIRFLIRDPNTNPLPDALPFGIAYPGRPSYMVQQNTAENMDAFLEFAEVVTTRPGFRP